MGDLSSPPKRPLSSSALFPPPTSPTHQSSLPHNTNGIPSSTFLPSSSSSMLSSSLHHSTTSPLMTPPPHPTPPRTPSHSRPSSPRPPSTLTRGHPSSSSAGLFSPVNGGGGRDRSNSTTSDSSTIKTRSNSPDLFSDHPNSNGNGGGHESSSSSGPRDHVPKLRWDLTLLDPPKPLLPAPSIELISSTKSWGIEHFAKAATAVFLLFAILLSSLVSKFSFLGLARRIEHAGEHDGHYFYAMVISLLIPPAISFVQNLWTATTLSSANNSTPSKRAFLAILLAAFLESVPLALFALSIAPRINSITLEMVLCCIFIAPLARSVHFTRIFEATQGYNKFVNSNHVDEDFDVERGTVPPSSRVYSPSVSAHSAPEPLVSHRTKKRIYLTAFAVQALGLAGVPVLYHFIGLPLWVCVVLPVIMLCLSLAFEPSFVKYMSYPKSKRRVGASARPQSGCYSNFFRMVFIIATALVVLKLDDRSVSLSDSLSILRRLSHDHSLVVLIIVNGVSGVLAKFFANLACKINLQRFSFILSMLLVTPLTVVGDYVFCNTAFLSSFNACFPVAGSPWLNLAFYLTVGALWVSQMVAVWEQLWNDHIPHLALDESLFYQCYYNGVFVDKFLPLNRKVLEPGQDSTSPEEKMLKQTVITCSTMYQEDAEEMTQMIDSVIKLSYIKQNQWESHVFMDGGSSQGAPGKYALQFIECLQNVAASYHGVEKANEWIETGRKLRTPYGLRFEWFLPESSYPIVLHLKDGSKVKKKKRWSQVMYMYYILQYRFPKHKDLDMMHLPPDVFILTTDADVRFAPEDVRSLLLLMIRDSRVGAVCGRTYPIGSGLLYWYQVFDYAVGHWFQKSAEHVYGTVLCCPGCFSMFRGDALRQSLLEYSSSVNEAFDFLTKDQGEDRWLCTLLIKNGWRLEYTAVAKNWTHCPTSFMQFFGQRVRWIGSTLANMILLIKDGGLIRSTNDNISFLFLIYQCVLLFSTIISPGTVLLLMVGGLNYSTSIGQDVISGVIFSIVAIFILICLTTPQRFQLLVSQILCIVFALVMGAVLAGWASDMASEFSHHTWLTAHGVSISTLYLLGIVAIFLITGLVHLDEFLCLIHGIWYLLGLPAGYLVLVLYSLCNLNSQSWGTRVSSQDQNAGVDLSDLWTGFGKMKQESFLHFFARKICCRPYENQDGDERLHPYSGIIEFEEERKNQKKSVNTWVVNEHGEPSCPEITRLLRLIRDASEKTRDDLTDEYISLISVAVNDALAVYPELRAAGDWYQRWRVESEKANKVALRDPSFWKKMSKLVEKHIKKRFPNLAMTRAADEDHHDGVQRTEDFLSTIGIFDPTLTELFSSNGFEDTTFFALLKESDLIHMGVNRMLKGEAYTLKIMNAIKSLPQTSIPSIIPPNLDSWLQMLRLIRYKPNFEVKGFGATDLKLISLVKEETVSRMGITKMGHNRKIVLAIAKLKTLYSQGITPQMRVDLQDEQWVIRDKMLELPLFDLHHSLLKDRVVFDDEEVFWVNLIETHLHPGLDPTSQISDLSSKLSVLRNQAVFVVLFVNLFWVLMMSVLTRSSSNSLRILHSNILGVVFLFVYGSILFFQFLASLIHRFGTYCQVVAATTFYSTLYRPLYIPSFNDEEDDDRDERGDGARAVSHRRSGGISDSRGRKEAAGIDRNNNTNINNNNQYASQSTSEPSSQIPNSNGDNFRHFLSDGVNIVGNSYNNNLNSSNFNLSGSSHSRQISFDGGNNKI